MISAKEEDFADTNKQICEHLFKANSEISLQDFEQLREKIKIALRHYEFHTYNVDDDDNTISAEDFAKSILVCLPWNQA
jgi:hypothetical protein